MTKPYVIGVAGSSGSGKTFFLNSFLHHFDLQGITLISQDDYYIPANTKTKEENKLYNFDLPEVIDRHMFYQHIEALLQGQAVTKEEYLFNKPGVIPRVLQFSPAPVLVVEGLFIFYYEEINSLLDYRIFIDANEDIALARRLKRDLQERGYDHDDVLYKWVNHVLPSFKQYLLPYKAQCDLVIHNNTDNPQIIHRYTADIVNELKEKLPAL